MWWALKCTDPFLRLSCRQLLLLLWLWPWHAIVRQSTSMHVICRLEALKLHSVSHLPVKDFGRLVRMVSCHLSVRRNNHTASKLQSESFQSFLFLQDQSTSHPCAIGMSGKICFARRVGWTKAVMFISLLLSIADFQTKCSKYNTSIQWIAKRLKPRRRSSIRIAWTTWEAWDSRLQDSLLGLLSVLDVFK